MENIVLYCKSFKRDVELAKDLNASIEKFNKDKIPFYISVPEEDINLFKNKLGTSNYNLIADEEIIKEEMPQNWETQQVIKASFWKLNLCKNYIMIDSDGFFIKDFYLNDFMYNEEIPYTICHEQHELFNWSSLNKARLGYDPHISFIDDRLKIMKLFGLDEKRVFYDFGPPPCIWSNKVWKNLEEEYIIPNKINFYNLIKYCKSEISWYGFSLIAFNSVPIFPREPLFKFFHYKQQYDDFLKENGSVETLRENYLGIVLQSNWMGS